jgi:hypothetical protein
LKNVTNDFKTAQSGEMVKVVRRISYKLRTWNSGTSVYDWDSSWTELPESSIVQVGSITAKLDTDRLNEFKVSNVDISVLNADGSWNPWALGGSVFTGKEPYWTKFKIESGFVLPDTSTEYIPLFVGVVVGFTLEAGGQIVKFNIQGLEAILINSNAESVSTTVSNETPSGTINSSNKDFVTLNPGVGIIDNVKVDSVDNKPGKHYDISQLNEPTLGAKITFKTAPTTGQTVKVWYRYWKQDQQLENLVTDLLTVAGVQSGASVQQVTFPGGVGDSFTIDSQSDWSMGTTSDGDITRAPGDLRIKMDASSNYELLDNFSDGNFTSNPTWTVRSGSHGSGWQIVGNKLQGDLFTVGSVIDTPANGRIVGCWITDSSFVSGSNGTGFSFCFSGGGTYNYDGNSVMQNHVGDRVEYGDKYTGTGASVRLVLNNVSVASKDVAWNNPTIKVIRYASGLVEVYLNGTLEIYGSSSAWNSASVLGYGGFYYSYDGLWQFDNINRPKSTLSSTWTSATMDMTSTVVSFGSLVSSVHVGGGTVTISTRTSGDGITWDSWVAVSSDGTINSTTHRYVQIKIVMTMPSSSHDEPYVSYLKLNYTKLTTTIKLANFTDKTCYQAIQSLGAFSNYEWGFKEDETFFFREKEVGNTVDLALDYATNLIEFETTNAGHDRAYSEVQATFGNYDIVVSDPGTQTGPLKRFGRKRFTVDGADLLISPDTDVATGIASGMYETMKDLRRIFRAKIKLTQWLDLSDTVSVTWATEFTGLLCKVIGVRHDTEGMVSELDLEEIFIPSASLIPFFNNDFESDLTNWTEDVDPTFTLYGYPNGPFQGSYSMGRGSLTNPLYWGPGGSGYIHCEIRDIAGSLLENRNLGGGLADDTWTQKTITLSGYTGQTIRIAIGDETGKLIMSGQFLSDGRSIMFYVKAKVLTAPTRYTNFFDYFTY